MLSLAKRVERSRLHHGAVPIRVGPYRLCLELASGGMATVYLAHDGSSGAVRFAAVKLVHPHLASDPGFAEMFVDEAEIASRIRHPNVCSVYDFDVSGGRSYIAMEYLLGESIGAMWHKLSRARRQDPKRIAQLAAKVVADACEGLHAAHELTDDGGEPLAVVHRDVSPGNIVLTFDGVTKVVDFGVAAAARKRHRTQTGMLKGKLAYMAPECLRGKKADRRSDLFAVGVVAWELVTGHRLFRRSSDVDTLRAVMDEPVRPPSEVRPDVPKELDEVIMRALAREPDERYETARELARDLAQVAMRHEVITGSDLGEWLETLFPGSKERKQQLLDLAAQIASDDNAGERTQAELTPPTRTIAASTRMTPSELERTRVYDRDEQPAHKDARPGELSPPRTRGIALWAVAAAAGFSALGAGAATWWLDRAAIRPDPSAREPEPLHAAPPPRERVQPELRLRPGAGFARGPYVLELVDSAADELVLRIRLDRAGSTEPLLDLPAPASAEAPVIESAPSPPWRRPGPSQAGP